MKAVAVRRVQALLAVFMLDVLAPCVHAGNVRVHLAAGTDMTTYRTYNWLPTRVLTGAGVVENDPVLTPLIKDAVNRELKQRGLSEVATGGDLQVATGVTTHAVPQVEAVLFAGPQDLTFATPIGTIGRYNRKGSLIVNLIDSRTKKSAWAGLAEEDLADVQGAGQKKIGKAAGRLFKKFPVKK